MVVREDHSGNEVVAGRATESVGGVGVDAARRTGRGGDRGGVGGVLPAVSLQTGREESVLHEKGVLKLNDAASSKISYWLLTKCCSL